MVKKGAMRVEEKDHVQARERGVCYIVSGLVEDLPA